MKQTIKNYMLSHTCQYAIRASVYLAIHSDGINMIGIKQISKDLKIPTPFLGKVLQILAKHKIINSLKGPYGGYSFADTAINASIFNIIQLFDGEDTFHHCLVGLEFCKGDKEKEQNCPMHKKSGPIRDSIENLYKTQKIMDLANDLKAQGNYLDI